MFTVLVHFDYIGRVRFGNKSIFMSREFILALKKVLRFFIDDNVKLLDCSMLMIMIYLKESIKAEIFIPVQSIQSMNEKDKPDETAKHAKFAIS